MVEKLKRRAFMTVVVFFGALGLGACDSQPDHRAGPPTCHGVWGAEEAQSLSRWSVFSPEIKAEFFSLSSARSYDLDGDGCLDFVFGAGLERNSYDYNNGIPEGRVYAVSGSDGSMLWEATTRGDMFGSAVFLERPDGVSVMISGREGVLVSVDGASGELLWEADPAFFGERDEFFGFYNPLIVEDVSGDGINEIVAVYGGDAPVGPGDPRSPSYVALLDGATGDVLGHRRTPDANESYTSPVLWERGDVSSADGEGTLFLFGTGGETLPGSLWLGSVRELLAPDPNAPWARSLADGSNNKGVIAPPVVADFTGDGVNDIALIDFGGTVSLLDGTDFRERWSLNFPGEESNLTGALLHRGDEAALAVTHNVGVFAEYESSVHRVLSGADGALLWERGVPLPFAPSPIAVDVNGDGWDEVLFGSTFIRGAGRSVLLMLDLRGDTEDVVELPHGMGSTPLVSLSPEGRLQLVIVGFNFPLNPPFVPTTLLYRMTLDAEAPEVIRWGGYMGTCGDGKSCE